jgi:pyrroline-5-carboxylate reductase
MTAPSVLLVGCGRLGSAIVTGWLSAGTPAPSALMIRNPSTRPAMTQAAAGGARINPAPRDLDQARIVVLAVKPAAWRAASAEIEPHLAADAVIVSVMAGVRAADIASALGGRSVARVMPTTGVSACRGAASVWSADSTARQAAHALFQPIATVVVLDAEDRLDAATAVSGSGQAYFFAFVEALARAGVAQGLDAATAAALARATLSSAAAGLEAGDASPADLIAEVASPGGTTQAALDVFASDAALDRLVAKAVEAAVARARELSQS